MLNLEDTVLLVVKDFMSKDILFTALDVSNEVKKQLPLARHREVRDAVRNLFVNEIESQGWARTPISVTLADGKTAEALLYHSLVDSWDLDSRYNLQQRTQTAARPGVQATALQALNDAGVSLTAGDNGNLTLSAVGTITLSADDVKLAPLSTPANVPMPTARTLWDNMFQTQPSLFPRK